MKKLIMLFALIIVAMISIGQNREGKVETGRNTLKYPINFTSADTITASVTYWILVDCNQVYAHTQSVALTLDSLSGAPSLSISLEGKTSALDDYTEIVSAATWDEEADNPFSMVVSSANKYRYFKIKIVASGATQKSKVTAVSFTDTYQNTTSILATTAAFSGDVLIGQTTANETTPSLTIKSDADSDAGGDTNESIIIDLTPNATPTNAVWDITSTQSAGYRFDKSLTVGLATPNETAPTLSVRGDADSDAADVTEALSIVLTPNATPTSATWGFTSTQSAGYTFDKAVTSAGLITGTAGATISGAVVSVNASSNFATNIGTGTTNAAVTLGGGSNTVEVASSSWDISTAGAASGFSSLSVSGLITGGFTLPTPVSNTDGSETLTWSQSGKIILATKSDGATTISLPDPAAGAIGAIYYILQTADQDLVLNTATANSNAFVCDGVATSDNVTISTAGHKIGAGMIVIGISATQYWVGGLNPESVLTPEAAD